MQTMDDGLTVTSIKYLCTNCGKWIPMQFEGRWKENAEHAQECCAVLSELPEIDFCGPSEEV